MKRDSKFFTMYVRNFIFGVEDSLVSTVGLLAGIAAAGLPRSTIILTGVVLIFVEAFSMAAGSFLSESSAEEYTTHKKIPLKTFIGGGVVMFFSYFLTGFIPLFPYIILAPTLAFWVSIALSLLALFILGLVGAKIFKTNIWRSGIRMLAIGGFAVLVGAFVGTLLQ